MDQDIRQRLVRPVNNPRINLPPPPAPTEQPDKGADSAKRLLAEVAKFVLLIVIIGGGIFGYRQWQQSRDSLPINLLKASGALFYPSKLPRGYHLDKSSIKNSGGVMIYSLVNGRPNNSISVTTQTVPQNFDPKIILKDAIKETARLPIGTAYNISTTQQRTDLVVTNTYKMLFVTSSTLVDPGTLNYVLVNLTPVN